MLWYANAGTAEGAFVIPKQGQLRKIQRLCRAVPLFCSSGLQAYLLLPIAERLALQGLVCCYLAPFRISSIWRKVGSMGRPAVQKESRVVLGAEQ